MKKQSEKIVEKQTSSARKKGFLLGGIFVAAISVLLMVAGYVITILSAEHAHQQKWQDYDDCGWA